MMSFFCFFFGMHAHAETSVDIVFETIPKGENIEVFVDGERICTQTEDCYERIAKGTHEITWRTEGYLSFTQTYDIQNEQTLRHEFKRGTGFLQFSPLLHGVGLKNEDIVFTAQSTAQPVEAKPQTLSRVDGCYEPYAFEIQHEETKIIKPKDFAMRMKSVEFDLQGFGFENVSISSKKGLFGPKEVSRDVKTRESWLFYLTVPKCTDLIRIQYVQDNIYREETSFVDLRPEAYYSFTFHQGILNSTREFESVRIPAGIFTQGAPCLFCANNKRTISNDFFMMTTTVTQGFYNSVMNWSPPLYATLPAINVTWEEALRFANELSRISGFEPCYVFHDETPSWPNKDCKGWRLPTEAEWEYAAKGGEKYRYSGSKSIDDVGWYRDNSGDEIHPVAQKFSNGFGLYDMSGNVWEWVWDSWDKEAYKQSARVDPVNDGVGDVRVVRGGGASSDKKDATVFNRYFFNRADAQLGFRLVRRK